MSDKLPELGGQTNRRTKLMFMAQKIGLVLKMLSTTGWHLAWGCVERVYVYRVHISRIVLLILSYLRLDYLLD